MISRDREGSLSLFAFLFVVLCIVLPVRFFVAKPFIVSGTSMFPTFDSWHYLIIDELTYRMYEPQRGDVIVMKYPLDPGRYFIKRIIGLPGEKVILSEKSVTIENAAHPEGFVLNETYLDPANLTDNQMYITLKDDQYFVMGDNRAASADSRYWGPLPRKNIVGRAYFRLFPFNKIEYLPGATSVYETN